MKSKENRECFSSSKHQLIIRHAYKQNLIKSFSPNFDCQLILMCLLIIQCIHHVDCSTIFTAVSSSVSNVGSLSNYSLSFNRSLGSAGQTITPSNLATSAYSLQIIFDSSYAFKNTTSLTGVSNYSIDIINNKLQITLNQTITALQIIGIVNPLPSQISFKITINLYNQTNPTAVIDTGTATLTFQSFAFDPSSISWSFSPGNVSTISNFSITLKPGIWLQNSMGLKFAFSSYWMNNLLNVSSNLIFTSMSNCLPLCTISSIGAITQIFFASLPAASNSTFTLTFYHIMSPPTLEPADTISITSVENVYNKTVQTATTTLSSSKPNAFQQVLTSTNNTIGQPITLQLNLTSQDLFAASDTIEVVLQEFVSSSSQISVNGIFISNFAATVQQNSIISLSSFQLISTIPSQFNAIITITNVSQQTSTRPVSNNLIQLFRNGYLYDASYFAFAAAATTMSSVSLSLSDNHANAISVLKINLGFRYLATSLDLLSITASSSISVYGCSIISCPTCKCMITAANISLGILDNVVFISNITNSSSITITLNIKNPISSNFTVTFLLADSLNYTKETALQSFPLIVQAALPSNLFSFSTSSYVVYSIANYSLALDLTNFSLLDGWALLYFDQSIGLLDSSNPICLVNNASNLCVLSYNGSLTANITISGNTIAYSITIMNLRNPTSTRPFKFTIQILSSQSLVYYTISSLYYSMSTPLALTALNVTTSNCTNSATAILTITLNYLPFVPANAILVDNPSGSINQQSIVRKINFPASFNSSFTIQQNNLNSLQPSHFDLLVQTSDLLYSIFSLQIQILNCQIAYLPILYYKFNGLPEDNASLTININQVFSTISGIQQPPIAYLTLLFPNQFPPNLNLSTDASSQTISPRMLKIFVGSTIPIVVNIWGFSNVLSSGYFQIVAFSNSLISGSTSVYPASSNNNTIKYEVSTVTSCIFPCKVCSSTNPSLCSQCYSSNLTSFNYLDTNTNLCVNPLSCSSNTFANSATLTCILCPPKCKTCTSLTLCNSCSINYYLLNSSCLTDCPNNYYPVSASQICSPCAPSNGSSNCQTCTGLGICLSCSFPYILSPSTKACVAVCGSNQQAVNNTCFNCVNFCQTCSVTLGNCTSCLSGYYLFGRECLAVCPEPFVISLAANVCVGCSSACLSCLDNPLKCTSCLSPKKYLNFTCVQDCPSGFYSLAFSNTISQCITCKSECTVCQNLSFCTSCKQGLYFYNNDCLYSCPLSTFVNPVNATTAICQPCSNSCLSCTSGVNCSLCQQGFYIFSFSTNAICTSQCGSGMFMDGLVCSSCPSNCFSCISLNLCLVCSSSSYLYNSTCISACPTATIPFSVSSNLPSSNLTVRTCSPCWQIYANCNLCSNTICTACQNTYLLNYDATCVQICPSGYLNLSSQCISCNAECSICQGIAANCTKCHAGYNSYFLNGSLQCLQSCPLYTMVSNSSCYDCQSPCLICVTAPTTCLSCKPTFFALFQNNFLQCVTLCPINAYNYVNTCIFCSVDCSTCDAHGCLSCSISYLKSPGAIYNGSTYYSCFNGTCPSYLPFLLNGSICSPCSQGCLTCNQTACISCSGGLFSYSLNCITSCPQATTSLNHFCLPCISPCLTCNISQSICLSCLTGFVAFYSSTQLTCISACPTNSYLASNNSCVTCNTSCSICDALGCLKCSPNLFSDQGSIFNGRIYYQCYSSCPQNLPFLINSNRSCSLCAEQCLSCNLAGCLICSSGYYSSGLICLSHCLYATTLINGQCVACISPCLTCLSSSTTCTSCINTYFELILNSGLSCVAICPNNSYGYSRSCVYCASDCVKCDVYGCLQCNSSMYTSIGFHLNQKTYFQCYSVCPTTLPFIFNSTCLPCSSNCITCDTISTCLQCDTNYIRYGIYCVQQCPPNMTVLSGSCIKNQTNTTALHVVIAATPFYFPVPFSVAEFILIICIVISKIQHKNTRAGLSILAISAILCTICNLVYMISKIITISVLDGTNSYAIILLAALILNYLNNIFFLIINKYSLMKDQQFANWIQGKIVICQHPELSRISLSPSLTPQMQLENHQEIIHVANKHHRSNSCFYYSMLTLGLLSSHLSYSFFFSRLFNLSVFKAYVKDVSSISVLNYVWGVSLVSHAVGVIGGIVKAVTISSDTSGGDYERQIYECSDIIFLNFIVVVLCLAHFRKQRQIYEKEEMIDLEDSTSTKKVIFDRESHSLDMQDDIQYMEEVDGKIVNIFDPSQQSQARFLKASVQSFQSSSQDDGNNTDLYFEKQNSKHPSNHQEESENNLQIDNGIIFMQINHTEMLPQLVERDNQNLNEMSRSNYTGDQPNDQMLCPEILFEKMQLNQFSDAISAEDKETDANVNKNNSEDQNTSNQQEQSDQHNVIVFISNEKDAEKKAEHELVSNLLPIQENEEVEQSKSEIRPESDAKSEHQIVQSHMAANIILSQSNDILKSHPLSVENHQPNQGLRALKSRGKVFSNEQQYIESERSSMKSELHTSKKRQIQTQHRKRSKRIQKVKHSPKQERYPDQEHLANQIKNSGLYSGIFDIFNSFNHISSSPALKMQQYDAYLQEKEPQPSNSHSDNQQATFSFNQQVFQKQTHPFQEKVEEIQEINPIQIMLLPESIQNISDNAKMNHLMKDEEISEKSQINKINQKSNEKKVYKSRNIAKKYPFSNGAKARKQQKDKTQMNLSKNKYSSKSNAHQNSRKRQQSSQSIKETFVDSKHSFQWRREDTEKKNTTASRLELLAKQIERNNKIIKSSEKLKGIYELK